MTGDHAIAMLFGVMLGMQLSEIFVNCWRFQKLKREQETQDDC